MKRLSFLLIGAGLFLSACCKDDDDTTKIDPAKPSTPTPPAVELNFDNRFGAEDFALNKVYVTKNGDSVAVGSFQYFVSNVELVKTDGSVYKVPDSYYLIQNTDQKVREKVSLPNIPAGEYTKLRFMVGIDSVRNQSIDGATGDLMPTHHMTWMWDTGFIFLQLNGQYYNPANSKFDGFKCEIGKDYSSRVVELNFPASNPKIQIGGEYLPKFHIAVDVKTIFGGPNVMDVKAQPIIDGTPANKANSIKVADNYATMFNLTAINPH